MEVLKRLESGGREGTSSLKDSCPSEEPHVRGKHWYCGLVEQIEVATLHDNGSSDS